MKYIQAIILAAIAVSSAANKGSEPVASPTAAEFDELYHRQLQKKTKAPTVPKTKAPVMTKAPVGDGTPVPTDVSLKFEGNFIRFECILHRC